MAVDATQFLRNRKSKQRRVPSAATSRPAARPPVIVNPNPAAPNAGRPVAMAASTSTAPVAPVDKSKIVEIKLFSSGDLGGLRFNLMRLHSHLEVDPRHIPPPVLFNRKPRGGQAPPNIAYDAEGTPVGKYKYDNDGQAVMDAEGQQVVEPLTGPDLALVGGSGGQKKKKRAGVREIHEGDSEAIKMRREEAEPWVLESGNPTNVKAEPGSVEVKTETNSKMPERWVGMMQEQSNMGSVLIVDNGAHGGFNVVPLGRTYRFDPKRPFEVADIDEAHKRHEYQVKHRTRDTWANRETRAGDAQALAAIRQEAYLQKMQANINRKHGVDIKPNVKIERFEDDYAREGRRLDRGMEGGEDEELDYDVNEDFQDDEDNNNFHRNEEEEEEQKRIEEQQRKEFKLANATVGDRPQIEEEDDSDEERRRLNDNGKQLRKTLRKRGEMDDIFGSEDEDSESDTESVKSEKSVDKKKEEKPVPGSAERPSRPPSQSGVPNRRTSSPAHRRPHAPSKDKAQTAPPGAGAALLAQRAASGLSSPRHKRTASPHASSGRGQSPDNGSVRGSSPVGSTRGGSPVSTRDNSPAPSREGSPAPNGSNIKLKGMTSAGALNLSQAPQKRKSATASPGPSAPGSSAPGTPSSSAATPNSSKPQSGPSKKRKPSPLGKEVDAEESRKKTKGSIKGSASPAPGSPAPEPFENMISRDEVHQWFRANGEEMVAMPKVIAAFKTKLSQTKPEDQKKNQGLFLGYVREIAPQQPGSKMLRWLGYGA